MNTTEAVAVQIGHLDGEPVILSSTAHDLADAWLDDVRRAAVREHVESSESDAAAVAAFASLQRLADLAADERVRLDATIELLKHLGLQ